MKKAFKLQGLGCANCAAKMESDINRLDGVNKATISFMTSRLVLDAEPDGFDDVVAEAQKICSKYEPECMIVR